TLAYEGGPIMSSARWIEVVWGSGFTTENAGLPEYVASYLADDAADSGKTTNVFAIDAQYSTSSQVLAYNQSFAGSVELTPAKCAGASACSLEESEIETELAAQIADGKLPAPTGDGMSTAYVVLLPKSITVTDHNASQSGVSWCSEHGSETLSGGSRMIFAMVPDLGSSGGCGTLVNSNDNVILSLSHQQNEMLTDPLVAQNELAWYDGNIGDSPGYGEIGDICVTAGADYGEETIGAHKWFVQNEWSNADNKCEASTKEFSPPTADFTATASANTASLSATGASSNHLGASHPAAIASYSWDFGDGQSGSGSTPSHTYAAAGTYTVSMTATDTLGFTAHATHQVTVSAPPSTGGGTTSGSGSTSGGSTGTGGSPAPAITSSGGSSTKLAGSTVLVLLASSVTCPQGSFPCIVKLIATARVPAKHRAHTRRPKLQTARVGTATIVVSAGTIQHLTLKLNGNGAKLLRKIGRLTVTVMVTVSYGSQTVTSTPTLTLTAPKAKHKRHR
ncbi:MAG TPA: PKD domain-containing protein, partial [Solirubrobacteraceae bacterium]